VTALGAIKNANGIDTGFLHIENESVPPQNMSIFVRDPREMHPLGEEGTITGLESGIATAKRLDVNWNAHIHDDCFASEVCQTVW
jgi:hypothetical protein